ncbi:MAG: hypothetical protein H8E08_00605 [Candidatus Marinimicrobia bacterium]|nr:hypothetical protein [Candidatus Neomarinimicrobiota bacterium]
MYKTISSRIRIWFLIVVLFVVSCTTGPLQHYPNFPTDRERITECELIGDVLVHASGKDMLLINLNDCEDIIQTIETSIPSSFRGKGLLVSKTTLSMIGGFLKDSTAAKIITEETKDLKFEQIPISYSPFSNNETASDSSFWKLLKNAYRDETNTEVLQDDSTEVMIVYLVRGTTVSFGKQLVEGLATAVLTMGMMTAYSTSTTKVSLYIIDKKTNRQIWSDSRYGQIEPNSRNVLLYLQQMIAKIPDIASS